MIYKTGTRHLQRVNHNRSPNTLEELRPITSVCNIRASVMTDLLQAAYTHQTLIFSQQYMRMVPNCLRTKTIKNRPFVTRKKSIQRTIGNCPHKLSDLG